MVKNLSDLDYVELYAEKLKNDSTLFDQQKKFIESQLKASLSLFKNMFSEKDFKQKAREYLKKRGIIVLKKG